MRINIIEDWKNAPKELKWFSLAIIPPFTGIFLLVYFWLLFSSHFMVFFHEKIRKVFYHIFVSVYSFFAVLLDKNEIVFSEEKFNVLLSKSESYTRNMNMKKLTEDNILFFVIALLVAIVCYLVFGNNSIWTALAISDVKFIASTFHVIYEFIAKHFIK
ncbi:hypothetical protein [Burkholderia cepacia]|uniref:hypothetical protein n=1 Tax=Burkholderia cepacia TaxID=292 RepID=UPI00158BD278|nr:hypothetical protein [Burkholderia cepacia]